MGIFGSKPDPRIAQLVAQTNQLTQLMAKQQQHLLKLTEKLFDLSKPPPPKPDVPEETRQEVIRRFNLDTNKYNWCIIGNSGAGKSTLVNTLRGLKPKDEGAAAVGIVETTHERKAYPMPNYPYATIWDLPGGGTEAHPAATYYKEHRMDVFDAAVLVTKDRFTEFDKAMLEVCKKKGVPCFLVRTKFDLSVTADCEDRELERPDVAGCMKRVKADLLKNIGADNADRVFVICGKLAKMGLYDMPRLIHAVLHATANSRFADDE